MKHLALIFLFAGPAWAQPNYFSATLGHNPEVKRSYEIKTVEGIKVCVATTLRNDVLDGTAALPIGICEKRWSEFAKLSRDLRQPNLELTGPCGQKFVVQRDEKKTAYCLDRANRVLKASLIRWWQGH